MQKQSVWLIWGASLGAILLGIGWVSTVGVWVFGLTFVAHVAEFLVHRSLFARAGGLDGLPLRPDDDLRPVPLVADQEASRVRVVRPAERGVRAGAPHRLPALRYISARRARRCFWGTSVSIRLVVASALVGAVLSAGCTVLPVRRGPAPEGYADRTIPGSDSFPNWPVEPGRTEELILTQQWEFVAERGAGAGTTGVRRVKLHFPDAGGLLLPVKWKEMDRGWKPFWGRLDGVNNSPRKEIAAYEIQSLVLDREDWVVPDTLIHCVPVEDSHDPSVVPTMKDSRCVLGVVSLWLKDVHLDLPLLDEERFGRDYAYAYFLSNLNLFTYLIKHHDGRVGNFLVSKDDARRQVFSIDNGVGFGDSFNGLWYNWFVANWNSLRVPALRKESIDRLRTLREEDVVATLGVVAQLARNEDGIYVNVPPGENLDPDDGVRIEGDTIQFGLTEGEIDDVWERIEDLIEDVDDGDIAVF